MTQAERAKKRYNQRKNNGLCVKCGKPLDRNGHYCIACLEKERAYNRETREWCRKNRICPVCRKNAIGKDEHVCPECAAKRYKWNLKRSPVTNEKKEEFRKQQNAQYKERIETGICTRCGKRKAEHGKRKCAICLQKDAELHRLKHNTNYWKIKEEREKQGLCVRCGQPLDRIGKICKACCEKSKRKTNAIPSENHPWRYENKLIKYKMN